MELTFAGQAGYPFTLARTRSPRLSCPTAVTRFESFLRPGAMEATAQTLTRLRLPEHNQRGERRPESQNQTLAPLPGEGLRYSEGRAFPPNSRRDGRGKGGGGLQPKDLAA